MNTIILKLYYEIFNYSHIIINKTVTVYLLLDKMLESKIENNYADQ